jgi:hypothetical protein
MKTLKNKMNSMATRAKNAISSNKAEGFVDSGIKILISVVIGALLLGGLYALFGDTILPTLTSKIQDLFNYAG